jgi:hydroxymethylpyrimidine kinase/phosphomethylpyrimidine kinase/thiamine-phosphate diphosphorylase
MKTTVWTFAANAKSIQQGLQHPGTLPEPALLCLNRDEAATLLRLPALDQPEAVMQSAASLRSALGTAVVVTGKDSDYADTPQASGWLSHPASPGAHPGTDQVFAAAAALALATGFVAMEAIVIASMARRDALSQHTAGGPLQPRPDFAQRSDNLPYFSLPQASSISGFAALSDADLGLYAVVDSAAWVTRVVAAGARTVQLRIKDADGEQHREFVRQQVRESMQAATAAGAQLFINDHWQLAMAEGAYGANLAAIKHAGLRLGISTHAYWEVCRAWALQPSYIACGPIHPTKAKAMPWIPQGKNNLAYWCKLLPLPVVGIAGMDVARTQEAAACGADGVAVISAITAAPSPEAAITGLQQALQRGRSGPRHEAPLLPRPTLAA